MEDVTMLLPYIITVNIIGFIMMRIDKQKAIKGKFRIPERTFWLLAILGGAIGIYMGMKAFRHKTKHTSFIIGVPVLIVINLVLFAYITFFLS
ncbi:DUF1294 domain-containing protein [Oceanobacillus piezotolerans]|uniref:DUF1294 domain-containing protein n=1 Tax=Oceanobacillus piezotolerans TaxID=2448030 RepID=A0A498DFD0_9BACI|nr:DUF1294 domain-containing protein [Oceanobacillus piezotolerans]RLL47908.1 DUF1294 domain-containing protein [Oceanobacillus piezotolerans]